MSLLYPQEEAGTEDTPLDEICEMGEDDIEELFMVSAITDLNLDVDAWNLVFGIQCLLFNSNRLVSHLVGIEHRTSGMAPRAWSSSS